MKHYLYFYLPTAVFLITAFTAVLLLEKFELQLLLNQFHHPVADTIFKIITHLGGIVAAFAFVATAFFFDKTIFKTLIIAVLISIGLTATIKYIVVPDSPRPMAAIENLRPVPGVVNHKSNSFPSGHSTFIFCLATSLLPLSSKKWFHFLLFGSAFLVAYSRVYISQHFVIDIAVGTCIGLFGGICGQLIFSYFEKYSFKP